MSESYTPRPGTAADALITHLQGQPAGTRMTIKQIAATFGVPEKSVVTLLRPSVIAGLLDFDRILEEGKPVRGYFLPVQQEEQDPPPAGPLTNINTDESGDLWFKGAQVFPNTGEVLLTRQQLRQLVKFATVPLIDHQDEEAQPA